MGNLKPNLLSGASARTVPARSGEPPRGSAAEKRPSYEARCSCKGRLLLFRDFLKCCSKKYRQHRLKGEMRDGGGFQPLALPRVCWGPEDARGDARGDLPEPQGIAQPPLQPLPVFCFYFIFFFGGICTSFHPPCRSDSLTSVQEEAVHGKFPRPAPAFQ